MFYIIGRAIFFLLSELFFKYRVYGRRNVPKHGAVIIASNHASYLDPIFVGCGMRRPLNFMARDSLFRNFFFGNLIRLVNSFPVKRNFQDVGAMRAAVSRLKKGRPLLIFPEATRTRDGNLREAKAGISFLSHAGCAPVVPVYIKGNFKVWPKGAKFIKPAPVAVFFGAALDFNGFFKAGGYDKPADAYKPFADYIMQRIADLKKAADEN